MTRHLITSALPYINGTKHLGNLVGSMLPADVYARFLRARGHEVLFICATDEHGTPAELAAHAAGLPVDQFCRQQHDIQADIYHRFALSFDHFGRSSSIQNRELTQHFARQLEANGLIETRTVKQVFSQTDGRFLPDRYVVGTCPHCGYDKARGDQCESCTRLLDPTDLIEPRSAVSGSADLQLRESQHLYLLQSKLADNVREWITSRTDWPNLVTSIALKWLDEGLNDRAITRDLHWGVPVPANTWPGLATVGKVFYVWFDAPIEYIGATKEWADQEPELRDWESWWRDAADVEYVQFMAKDNIPFHAVMFPGMIQGTGESWTMPGYIKGFNWLNYYGGKFSTSQRRGIFTDQALELLPADYWRYYLISNAPESDDVTFSWEQFATQTNKDLADVLGNFVNRVLTFTHKRFGEHLPAGGESAESERELGRQMAILIGEYEDNLAAMRFRKASANLRSIWSLGNEYFTDQAPWTKVRTDENAAALTLRTAANVIYLFGLISAPIIPATAQTLREIWAIDDSTSTSDQWPDAAAIRDLNWVPAGTAFTVPDVLFRKISDEDVTTWRERFGTEV